MRSILHCDCNSFFASAEMRDNPSLKNVPMAVGGDIEKRTGIILAKNEIAKRYKVKTAETIGEAKKKCPDLIIVPPRHDRYAELSEEVNSVYEEYTEFVERFGIDESWLDVTESRELFGSGEQIANELRRRIREEVGLTISVGVSFTKAFAKLGSDYKKPDATTVIMPGDVFGTVYPLPLSELLYAGKSICAEFAKYGVETIGDLAKCDGEFIKSHFGKNGMALYLCAKGEDCERVRSIYEKEEVKSIGNSYTFPKDLLGEEEIGRAAVLLGDAVSARMRRSKVKCGAVSVILKDDTLKTITRQMTLSVPTNYAGDLTRYAMELIKSSWNMKIPVRMLGISGSSLVPAEAAQSSLFETEDGKKEKIFCAMDAIRGKFGNKALKFASAYSPREETAKEFDENK